MSKHYAVVVVSFETGGGHGEMDAIEEGLRNKIESHGFDVDDLIGTYIKVELLETIN